MQCVCVCVWGERKGLESERVRRREREIEWGLQGVGSREQPRRNVIKDVFAIIKNIRSETIFTFGSRSNVSV